MVKKKKESKALNQKQKSRAQYPQPDGLKELIRQVKLIPPDYQLKSFEMVIDEQKQLLRKQTGDDNAIPQITEALKVCLENTPEEFQQHIENEALKRTNPFGMERPHMIDVYDAHTRAGIYCEYFDMRLSMLRLIERLETERQMMRDVEVSRQLKPGSITFQNFTLTNWDSFPLSISTVIERKNGELKITGLASLIGEFDDSRLRRCEICKHIYWAKRENSKTCSPKCLNLFNVRRHRALTDEEKAEKKATREANKKHKQRQKELRSKNNGTL